ncbi:peroxiredoxin Q/BCP [Luteibacter sp. Sphag1AF]|uniref:peroxiredoxin n=1 Tax=Luteibacter sp. Sphag1AF TaxID=2587031 RepID=UPI001618EDCB|nr:peroxiredoxin [Luteibacter sp. Sphag1AF]MBB3227873.1 peroxiredoxin Q/BCP [Luteibacter sp. Sphag1AF]
MRRLIAFLAFAFVAVSAWAAEPAVGQQAPDFRLQDQKGEWHTLDTHKGQWLVVYFYPKDFTPGCTTEVCTFRDDIARLHKAGATVLGVSLDDVKSHAEFAEKYHVPFPLLSDADGSVAQKYDVLTSKLGMKYARRETFLIDPAGKIVKIYKDVDPEKNSAQVLADLASLKAANA